MSLQIPSVVKEVITTAESRLPKVKQAVSAFLGLAGLVSLNSCAMDPYAYGGYQQARQEPPRRAQEFQEMPDMAYNQAPYQGYNNVGQQRHLVPGQPNLSIQEQIKIAQNHAATYDAYSNAVRATADAMRANIPPRLQNEFTRRATDEQARAITPRNLSFQEYRDLAQLKYAQAQENRAALSARGFY